MTTLLQIGIGELIPDPTQPRKVFLQDEIDRLAASLLARGVLAPLRVSRDAERGCWLIVSGESRWRAARQAGLATVPCVAVTEPLSEVDRLSDQIIENHCRRDLTPLEFARAVFKVKKLKGVDSQTLAKELGLSNATLSRAYALLKLPEDVQRMVDDGLLNESNAYELTKLPDEASMRNLAEMIVGSQLKRSQVRDKVRLLAGEKKGRPKPARVTGKLDGVAYSFTHAGGQLTPDALLKIIDQLRAKLKELKGGQQDVTGLSDLEKAS